MIKIRQAKDLFSRIAASVPEILGSAGADAWHGVHYGCDSSPCRARQPEPEGTSDMGQQRRISRVRNIFASPPTSDTTEDIELRRDGPHPDMTRLRLRGQITNQDSDAVCS